MIPDDRVDTQRRALLQRLGSGFFLLGAAPALALDIPGPLPPSRSIYRLQGEVLVNGRNAGPDTPISADDRLQTGPGSQVVFVVGQDAFLLRERADLQLSSAGELAVHGLRLLTGALLSVFGQRRHEIQTLHATIGIRGTGIYVETEAERSYVCTCYGQVRIRTADDPQQYEDIVSRHHDAPRYIAGGGAQRIQPAPLIHHTDAELAMIEALVGRVPPFSFTMPGWPGGLGHY